MKIYIPQDKELFANQPNRRELFLLSRPFWNDGFWVDNTELKKQYDLNPEYFSLTLDLYEANCVLIPLPLQYYRNQCFKRLELLLQKCFDLGIMVHGFVAGDYGEKIIDHPSMIVYRMGGFRSQLSQRHQGLPSALSDHLIRLFGSEDIEPKSWQEHPLVGFCGHASSAVIKAGKEKLKFLLENLRRFLNNPLRSDYEPLFASALERWNLLQALEQDPLIQTNFIYREHYRAGARTPEQLEASTLEYYQNLRKSTYILCVRGGGNFSVRLYETLMMGRIPVFVNTDCLLPFPELIPWKEHMVWVEWDQRHLIAEKILDFHHSLTPEQFKKLQYRNRQLWKEKLTLSGMYGMIFNLSDK